MMLTQRATDTEADGGRGSWKKDLVGKRCNCGSVVEPRQEFEDCPDRVRLVHKRTAPSTWVTCSSIVSTQGTNAGTDLESLVEPMALLRIS